MRTMMISTSLLKVLKLASVLHVDIALTLSQAGAARGLTLFEIASLASRASFDEPCTLETLVRDLPSDKHSLEELLAALTAAINDLPSITA